MSNETSNQTPRQMEFTVQLPDREVQYQKTPAKIVVTKQTVMTTQNSTIMPDGTRIDEDPITSDPISKDVEIPLTQDVDDGQGGTTKQEMSYGDLLATVHAEQDTVGLSGEDLQSIVQASKTSNRKTTEALQIGVAPVSSMSANLCAVKGVADALDVEETVKEKGVWGLGCPGNCGHFWEFTYKDMISQVLTCPICGAKIKLQ